MQKMNMNLDGKKDRSVTDFTFVSLDWSNASINKYMKIFAVDSS